MGLFSRKTKSVLPPALLGQLSDYGREVLDARRAVRPIDARFGWEFIQPVMTGLQDASQRDGTIEALYVTATGSPQKQLAMVGAYNLLSECEPSLRDERYLLMLDATLAEMHHRHFSSGHLNGFERDRWVEKHGDIRSSFDGIFSVSAPEFGDEPTPQPLAVGESRMLAQLGPSGDDNRFFAEHREDDSYVVYSLRIRSVEDPTIMRCDEAQMGTFESLQSLLRAVGQMFDAPTYWAHEDLLPYFPSRRA